MSDTELVDQPSARPTRKWIAGTSSGGAALLLIWVAGLVHLELSPEVAGAIVLAAAAAAAWLKRNAPALVDCLDAGPGAHAVERDLDGDGRVG